MAINPNTDFTAGAVLTAAQQNRFPRGVVALTFDTATANFGAEAVNIITESPTIRPNCKLTPPTVTAF